MGRRLDLHEILVGILGSGNVYFQPPETIKMKYPCIVYEWASNNTQFADNYPYYIKRRYTITVIDPNPDSEIPDRVSKLQMCKPSNTNYQADKLNHYPFDLYY